jgi:hypothetical protein
MLAQCLLSLQPAAYIGRRRPRSRPQQTRRGGLRVRNWPRMAAHFHDFRESMTHDGVAEGYLRLQLALVVARGGDGGFAQTRGGQVPATCAAGEKVLTSCCSAGPGHCRKVKTARRRLASGP